MKGISQVIFHLILREVKSMQHWGEVFLEFKNFLTCEFINVGIGGFFQTCKECSLIFGFQLQNENQNGKFNWVPLIEIFMNYKGIVSVISLFSS
jgi:hypothetical protein